MNQHTDEVNDEMSYHRSEKWHDVAEMIYDNHYGNGDVSVVQIVKKIRQILDCTLFESVSVLSMVKLITFNTHMSVMEVPGLCNDVNELVGAVRYVRSEKFI